MSALKRAERRREEAKNAMRGKEKPEYEGALPMNELFFAKNRNGKWMDAKIIEVRPLPGYNENDVHDAKSYRYYVHFEGKNRRLDQWVTVDSIREWQRHEQQLDVDGPVIEHDEHQGLDERQIAKHEEVTKLRRIEFLEIGKHRCQTWYFTPLPEHLQDIETLYSCEFCLNFFRCKEELLRHNKRCALRHPPGNEIYRDENMSIFEVDGARNPTYCENLCFIAKLFLDHKTLAFDVTPFLFYVLTENNESGCRYTGYFSKEKKSDQGYNLACILVMPYSQGTGYGKFLISFSYELSRIEKRMGTPERPLSDLGFKAYFKWWAGTIIEVLLKYAGKTLSINELSQITYIKEDDIQMTLEKLNLLRYSGGNWSFYANEKYLSQVRKTLGQPGRPLYPEKLHWTPYRGS